MEEIQQLRRRLNEQILERAEADPQWKQRYIQDPHTAIEDIPETRQLRRMHESTRPPEEQQQLRQRLWERVLDKAARDPQWKQWLLDDPEAAIQEANLPEIPQYEEVHGQRYTTAPGGGYDSGLTVGTTGCTLYCKWTLYYYWVSTW
jgi:hypothetical protein